MDEVKRALEQEILVEREELKDHLQELGDQARNMVDWKHHYRNNTGAALALTFGAGVAVGLMVPSSPRRAKRSDVERSREPREFRESRESREFGESRESRARESHLGFRGIKKLADNRAGHHVADTASGIFDALLGVLSARAVNLVSDLVGGFKEEYDARQGSRGRSSDVTH